METIIKFENSKNEEGYVLLSGTIEAGGFKQTFKDDKELHQCIDIITERGLREVE
jgi:hypothetical protein